jgi:16S rRNA (uracil1498-N3)-methyltransferase
VAERFYAPEGWRDGRALLDGDEARHLTRVCRIEVGGRVGLFDGTGMRASAEVVRVDRDRVELVVVESGPGDRDLEGMLVLAAAVPKGDRFDWLVEKATEIGVARLVPILAERSVVDPSAAKLDRLRRRVIEACKQSGRSRLMEVGEPVGWSDWLERGLIPRARLVADPGGGPLCEGPRPDLEAGVAVAVGPEGGFTSAEIVAASRAGFRAVALGPTILRVETAALAACAAIVAWAGTGKEASA